MAQDELQKLINLISRLPGVGQRSAQRIALYLIKNKQELMLPLGESIKETAAKVRKCEICGMLDVNLPTKICSSDTRIKNFKAFRKNQLNKKFTSCQSERLGL